MADIYFDVDVALAEVPVNKVPLVDDTDFKTIEGAVAYDAAGMALRWHFVTSAGAYTVTSVTPTTGGTYDWTDQGDSGIYTIEIPATGGASINNDTEGYGWFTGVATGILPWCSPIYGFRAAGLNDLLLDSAYSATRGLSGTALPNAAADAAGGLPISDAGGLDMDNLPTLTRDKVTQRTTLRGTVAGSATTTSITTSAMSPATTAADQVKGRIVVFDHDTTTAALRGQATDITASSASATPTLTVTALTTAPASGDTFTIV